MRLVSGTTYGADKKILLTLYKALILSKIDYGAQAYNSASKSLLSKLDIIQNHALRIATRAYYSTPINALEVECGIKPLRLRREENTEILGQVLTIRTSPTNKQFSYWSWMSHHKKSLIFNPYSVTIRKLLKEHKIEHDIQKPCYMDKWDLVFESPSLELKDKLGRKSNNSENEMKISSLKYISKTHTNKIKIYTDSSKDPTANTAGAAFVVPELGHTSKIKLNPILSVFTPELIAIEHAITWILKGGIQNSVILTDSLSAIQALQYGKSRSRPDKVDKILSLLNLASTVKFNISIEWIPAHVGIEGNESADMAAKETMTTGTQDPTRPSKSEIYYLINNAINKKWQSQWTHNNKGRMLHFGQPTVKTQCDIYSTNRRLDTVYTRLRLGHCGLGSRSCLLWLRFPQSTQTRFKSNCIILFPPKKDAKTIQNAVFEFLRKTQYIDKI